MAGVNERPESEVRPETLLVVPVVLALLGLLGYLVVERLPTVRVLPG